MYSTQLRRIAILFILLINFIIAPSQAWARPSVVTRIRALFSGPQEIGKARRVRQGASVRDPDLCPTTEQPLTALVPDTKEPVKTSQEYPVFWFYLPYPIISGDSSQFALKFVLQDSDHNDIYQSKFTLSETISSGIIGLRLSSQAAALEVGKTYRWYFLIYCDDPQEIYEPAFVEGLIQREALNPNLKNKIEEAPPQERFLLYAEELLWYDTLTALVEAREDDPENSTLIDDWSSLLQGVDFDQQITQQPIVGRYYIGDI
ncbi:MAG: DUF928 domain-containing protein [Symploca sp. SIO2E9]|nr:DUF928 domain-containing protein [Symploca sp. SIO2E9]